MDVKEGQTAILTCEINKSDMSAVWSKDGEEITPDNQKYTVTVQNFTHTLTITDCDIDDDSEYSINIEDCTSVGNVFVEGMFYLWALERKDYKNYLTLMQYSQNFLVNLTFAMLQLWNFLFPQDSTSIPLSLCFYCVVSKVDNFIVEDIVDIVKPLEDQTVEQMDIDVSFTCELTKPNTKVYWYKGKVPITPEDNKYTITNIDCQYTLTVKGVKPDDESDYTIDVKGKKSTAELFIDSKLFLLSP